MPIENIKIIRDGEIIQTTGIDGLLLEKVGIYEYLNLTKKIYEGKSLTIQIKDSTSVTYAVYKEEKPVKQPELFVSYIHAYVNTSLRYIIESVLSESQW